MSAVPILGVFCASFFGSSLIAAENAIVLDRVAVVVGKHVIKASDIALDQRLTAFLNREPVKESAEEKKRFAERLIDQELIRREIDSGGYRRPTDVQAGMLESQLIQDRFGGSVLRMQEALRQYGLTRDELHEQLLWQLTVLSFIDQRFRNLEPISDDEIRSYYDQHRAELRRQYPQANGYEALESNIRTLLEGEAVNKSFTQWLGEARGRNRIEYKQEALK